MTEVQQCFSGAAFASIKRGEMGFAAIVQDSGLLPGVKAFSQLNGCKQFSNWEDLLETWRQQLIDLAAGFCSGDARVDPKNYPATCEHCDLQLFCRIYERLDDNSIEQDDESV
jgi:hypothetical protein